MGDRQGRRKRHADRTGYPGDYANLLASLELLKVAPEALSAILITHAHNDHIGSAERLRAAYGVPVLMHADEVPLRARRDFLDQVSVGKVAANAWRPGVVPWAVHALRSGGTAHVPVARAAGLSRLRTARPARRPGPAAHPRPRRGHCAYLLPARGIVVGEDALGTGHPTSRLQRPGLLPAMYHKDRPRALATLDVLAETDADVSDSRPWADTAGHCGRRSSRYVHRADAADSTFEVRSRLVS